jgi:hypothetical protein
LLKNNVKTAYNLTLGFTHVLCLITILKEKTLKTISNEGL